ncbi:hypothetical protein ACFQI7_27475 [Paenibacillus allorhizosphaerae]|uniref:Permease n=1 Tax=Paenibacillus allorhizosphaerae TaxID=2849866 RepID=A0ABM8VND9_9BACL|nr:hypothetical protein [Paenibacillus allorhizosphaerae]CAG7651291.1 hypothetical protein PAECIP111802_04927 [Paenibacillus allorhizosphaerae]
MNNEEWMILLIGLIIPLITTFRKYVITSIVFWIGFIFILIARPWHEYKSFEGMLEVLILYFVVVPLYSVGIVIWLIASWKRKQRI